MYGGALIAPNLVATAAAGFIDYNRTYRSSSNDDNSSGDNLEIALIDSSRISVHFGNISVSQPDNNAYKISKIATTNNSGWLTNPGLLALIVFEKDVPSSVAIPAEIYDQKVTDGAALQLAGFGSTSKESDAAYSEALNYLDVKVSLSSLRSKQNMFYNNADSYVCSAISESKKNCYGDFGGPLTTAGTGVRKLVGISTHVAYDFDSLDDISLDTFEQPPYQCAKDGDIMVYLNPPHFANWIEEQKKALNLSSSTPSSTSKPPSSSGRLAPYGNSQGSFAATMAGLVLLSVFLGTV